MLKAYIKEIVFSSGLNVALNSDSILLIVGPNNSGKSATLSGIKVFLEGFQPKNTVPLMDVLLHRCSKIDELLDIVGSPTNQSGGYSLGAYNFHELDLERWWGESEQKIGPFLCQLLISDLTTRQRLEDCDPVKASDLRVRFAATHPFHHMYRDSQLEERVSRVVRRAFKADLVMDRSAGGIIPAYIGERPILAEGEDRTSLSYVSRIEKLGKLESQGDGIRSFVSIVSRVLTEDRPIQLIDEPEAFLHPPQARLVAETVAAHGGGRQTIIATHSSEVVQGLLSENASRVSVVRLSRVGDNASATYLSSERVAALWRDPILRFSNILDGLFHDGVIVTEADADCRFYEAVANVSVPGSERPDIHYTYSGGKDRLPTVIAALVGVAVPVATIVDFDVLNNDQPLRKIFEAHGGAWATVESDWKAVKKAVEAREAFLGGDQFVREISDLLKQIPKGEIVPKNVLAAVKKLSRRASPWDNIKSSGLSAIAAGEPTIATNRLLDRLAEFGVFVAPQGEMEGFCRSIGGHGPRWVEEALKRDLASDSEFQGARDFAERIVAFLRDRAS